MQRKNNRLTRWLIALSLAALMALTGCATGTPQQRIFWPPPPEQPRLEYVGVYSGEADLPTTGWRAFKRATVGLDHNENLKSPSSVASNGQGQVYVAMPQRGKIKVFDFNRLSFSDFLAEAQGKPYGLAIDSKGNLYVANHEHHNVSVFSAQGAPLFAFGAEVLRRPVRIALNERLGRIYVSDPGRQQVVVFGFDGKQLLTIGGAAETRGGEDGEFNVPAGIAIDRENRLFVCDQLNARIQVFDADGKFLYKFGERGDRDWQFESPRDLAFDSDNNLWLVDFRKAALLTYSPKGDWLMTTRGPGATNAQLWFATPGALTIDAQDRIYIVDFLNDRISVWQYVSAAYLAAHPLPTDWMTRTDVLDIWKTGNPSARPPVKSPEAGEAKPALPR